MERFFAALLGSRISFPHGLAATTFPTQVVLRRSRWIPWLGGLLSGMKGPAAAVTLGHTIILKPEVRLTPALLAHELAHIRQWEQDRLFPVRYSLAHLRFGYRDNPYEIEAREMEDLAARTQSGEEMI